MTTFVESLKRLYAKGVVSESKIDDLYNKGKISLDDKNYILS